jgi:3-phosphoglycerate kinase
MLRFRDGRFFRESYGPSRAEKVDYPQLLPRPSTRLSLAWRGKGVDKIGVIHNLLPKLDALLVGGHDLHFLRAENVPGRSLVEEQQLGGERHFVPRTSNATTVAPAERSRRSKELKGRPREIGRSCGQDGLDIGPSTVAQYGAVNHGKLVL